MTITDHQRHNTEVLTAETASSSVVIPQYSRRAIVAVWAAAAVPMAVLSADAAARPG